MDNWESLIAARMRPCVSMPRYADPTKERKKAYYTEHKEHIRTYYKEWYDEQKEAK